MMAALLNRHCQSVDCSVPDWIYKTLASSCLNPYVVAGVASAVGLQYMRPSSRKQPPTANLNH
eukprot:360331-Chlamydomonas_euryale.AAC.6